MIFAPSPVCVAFAACLAVWLLTFWHFALMAFVFMSLKSYLDTPDVEEYTMLLFIVSCCMHLFYLLQHFDEDTALETQQRFIWLVDW